MKKEDIKERDILINPYKGFCGYVVAITKYIKLRPLAGEDAEFNADCLEPATPEQAANFQGKIPAVISQKSEEVAPRPRKGKTPEEINAGLERYVAKIAAKHPASAEQFKGFWREVIAIIGEHQEGKKWDMRWRSVKHFCPVLKGPSHRSNEWVSCIYLLFGENVRIEVRKSDIPADLDTSYPIRNVMRGSTNGFKMNWTMFNAGKRAEFLSMLKILHTKWQGNGAD